MKKICCLFLFALMHSGFICTAKALPVVSSDPYIMKSSDFLITKIEPYLSADHYGLNVSIYFKQSRTKILPYPSLNLVTNLKGDTLGTGYTEYFMQRGQDTVVYHLNLRRNEIPKFEDCIFYFSGPALDVEKDDVCKLTFAGEKSIIAPTPTILNCSQLKITEIKIYDPKVILPELEVSVYFDSDHNKMLEAPYIKCVKDPSGKIIADGYKSHQEFYCHQGKDTLIYHLYFRNNKIPDLSDCGFYFCSPGKLSGKDSVCVLTFVDRSTLPSSPQKNYKFKQSDLKITKIEIDSSKETIVLNISVYLNAPKNATLSYPCMSAVTDSKGDTLTLMPFFYFDHSGKQTKVYHLLLRKREIPDLSNCSFHFSGSELEENCLLTYSKPKKNKRK